MVLGKRGGGCMKARHLLAPSTNPFPQTDDQLRTPLPCWLREGHAERLASCFGPLPPAQDCAALCLESCPNHWPPHCLSQHSELKEQKQPLSSHSYCMAGPGLRTLVFYTSSPSKASRS